MLSLLVPLPTNFSTDSDVQESEIAAERYEPHSNARVNLNAQIRRGRRTLPDGFNPRRRGNRRSRAPIGSTEISEAAHGLITATQRPLECDGFVPGTTPSIWQFPVSKITIISVN